MQQKLYALIPTRQVILNLQARTQGECSLLNNLSGDECYTDRDLAAEHGLMVTRALKFRDDIAIVHVQYPGDLHARLVSSKDIQPGPQEHMVKLSADACALLNDRAHFTVEIYTTRPTEGPAVLSSLGLDIEGLKAGLDYCPYAQTDCACHNNGVCACGLPQLQ
jgi:hypothetical protein